MVEALSALPPKTFESFLRAHLDDLGVRLEGGASFAGGSVGADGGGGGGGYEGGVETFEEEIRSSQVMNYNPPP